MRSLLARTLAFALLAALLAGLFFTLQGQGLKGPVDDLVFSSREPTQIARIAVSNSHGTYTISLDEQTGGYLVGDLPAELVDMDAFIHFMVQAAALRAQSKLAGAGDLAAYGLTSPQAQASIRFTDGQQLGISLGKQEEVSGNYYLKVEGKPWVYTCAPGLAAGFLRPQEGFLSLQVTPPLSVSSPLSAIRDAHFEGRHLGEAIQISAVMGGTDSLRLEALSFGAATHLVRGRGLHALDQAGGIRVLGSLLGIRAMQVVGYHLGPEGLQEYGFLTPDLRVDFVLADRATGGQPFTLSLVQAAGDTFYAHVLGRDAVYLINRPAFYDLSYEQLILRYFISPMLVDVSGLTVRAPEGEYHITLERPPGGEARALLNGQQVDWAQFLAFYRLVTSAAADGGLIDQTEPQTAPALELIYHYKTPEKADDVLRFYPGSPRRMAVSVNGVIELDIRESFVSRLILACQALEANLPVEENW